MRSKIKIWGATVALALGLPTAANAAITIDPDGAGAQGAIVVGTLDWAPTSFLAIQGNTAVENWIASAGTCPANSCNFNVVVQARLQAFQDTVGNAINGTGLGTSYQWTMVAMFTEKVVFATTTPTTGLAQFQLVSPNPANNFLEIFYDPASNQNQLTGAGFNDGTLILKATTASQNQVGTLTVSTPVGCNTTTNVGCPALDQAGGDNYPGQATRLATGNNPAITTGGITTDTDFFLANVASVGLTYQNIGQDAPFLSVDPMTCFDNTVSGLAVGSSTVGAQNCLGQVHANGPYSLQVLGGNGGYIPVTGPLNAPPPGSGSPDGVYQTDFNSPINGVPEPGSLALLGAVLGAAGFIGRRRRGQK